MPRHALVALRDERVEELGIALENRFTLDMAPDEAWRLLNDIERIAPCMPGAQLTAVEGDAFHGKVRVKIGPITAEYAGVATITARDPGARRLTVEGRGKDIRGQGTAGADVIMVIVPSANGSEITVSTDVQLTGKVAQLGRSVMQDVSTRLVAQFVSNLSSLIAPSSQSVPGETGGSTGPDGIKAEPRAIASPEPEAIDLARLGGAALPVRSICVGAWMVAVLVVLVMILLK